MSYQGRYGSINYARAAKLGFFAGLALFAIGSIGELVGHAYFESMPVVAEQALFGMEVLGILVGLIVPIVYGVVLPLTE